MRIYFFAVLAILAVAAPATAVPDQAGPRVEVIEGVQREVEQTYAAPLQKGRYELPVEAKNADGTPRLSQNGKRQFELRSHLDNGSDSIDFLTPIPAQENLERPTVFYWDARENGEIVRHEIYTVLPQEESGIIMLMASTVYKRTKSVSVPAPPPAPTQQVPTVADGVYHVSKYPVHADKDAYSRLFYHLTIIEGQPPVLVIPRVDTDLFNDRSKATYPGRVIAGALNLPDYYANIRNNFDYSTLESPKMGDRWRDWMFVDARSNITYFQLIPAHKMQKGKDGNWDVHVSKEPPPIIDIRKSK